MKRLLLSAALVLLVTLQGCGLLPLSTPPAAVPTFYLPTDLPTYTPTPTPTPTHTPTPTATASPVLAGNAGEIYVTLVERPPDAKFMQRLVRFPAGCVDCPAPEEAPGPINPTGVPSPLVWSPDGKTAALAVPSYGDTPASVQFYDPARETWFSAAEFDEISSQLYWSPDGNLLALYAVKDGKPDFYTISPDGSQVTNVTRGALAGYKQVIPAGWLNGELVFSALTTRGVKAQAVGVKFPRVHILSNIIVLSGYEKKPLPLLPSPDNRWIAYTEITPRVGQSLGLLRVKDTEVSHNLVSSKDGRITGYTWSPDGQWLAFWLRLGEISELDLVRPDGSGLHPVYVGPQEIRAALFDPGGSGWILVETESSSTGMFEPSHLLLVHAETGRSLKMSAPVGTVSWEGASWRPEP